MVRVVHFCSLAPFGNCGLSSFYLRAPMGEVGGEIAQDKTRASLQAIHPSRTDKGVFYPNYPFYFGFRQQASIYFYDCLSFVQVEYD